MLKINVTIEGNRAFTLYDLCVYALLHIFNFTAPLRHLYLSNSTYAFVSVLGQLRSIITRHLLICVTASYHFERRRLYSK